MTYKKKTTVLSGIIAALALIYIMSIIFDPERRGARSDVYSWLDAAQNDRISDITIMQEGETIILTRNGGRWFVSHNGKDYPARTLRIEDFIAALNKRAPYPVRSSSAASHARLSLTEDRATRITVMAGAGLPVLTLLAGQEDSTGHIFLRKQGHNEVRSGENIFSAYTNAALNSWYNLRLFPENEDGSLTAASVQRLTVYPSAGEELPPQIFTRNGNQWTFNFELANPNMARVDNYIRDILNTAGSDFAHSVAASHPMFNDSRISIEFGNGGIRTIRFAPPDEEGQRMATISGADMVYTLPSWASQRLFVNIETFELD
ncbi:MAG: DUF4340 domain-containing protein [Treponema sp.]|nr:DUF4340 domain-containing protein [Treponema sp.]